MKKFKVLLLCLVLSSFAFVRCKDPLNADDGYMAVSSVSYEGKTIHSMMELKFDKSIEITENVYNVLPDSHENISPIIYIERDQFNINDYKVVDFYAFKEQRMDIGTMTSYFVFLSLH